MRVCLSTLLPVVCALLVTPTWGRDWKTLADAEGRFTISHPARWSVVSDTSSPQLHLHVISAGPVTDDEDTVRRGLTLLVLSNPSPAADEALSDAVADVIGESVLEELLPPGRRLSLEGSHTAAWGNARARVGLARVSGPDRESVSQVLVAMTPEWVFMGIVAFEGEEPDAELARVRDSFTATTPTQRPEPRVTAPADAGRIAFVRRNEGENAGSELWLLDLDTRRMERVTNFNGARAAGDPVEVEQPAWSPDRTRIAFASNFNGERNAYPVNVFSIAADGSDLRQLTFPPQATAPGRTATITGQVQFARDTDTRGAPAAGVRVTAEGASEAVVTDAWGRFRITGVRAGEPWVRFWGPEGDSETRGFAGENPSMLLWPQVRPGEVKDLGTVRLGNAPGSFLSTTRLTEPQWARDGRSLVFVRRVDYEGKVGQPRLMVMNDPEWIRRRGYTNPDERNPWLPRSEVTDGLAFILRQSQLFEVLADGSETAPVTPVFFSDGAYPRLSDDGKLLFKFSRVEGDGVGSSLFFAYQGDAEVAMVDPRGGEDAVRTVPVRLERHSGLAVSPSGRYLAYVRHGRPAAELPADASGTDRLMERLSRNPGGAGTLWGPLAVYDFVENRETIPDVFGEERVYIADLAWSSEGRRIVFSVLEWESVALFRWSDPPSSSDLYLFEFDTMRARRITTDGRSFMPAW